MARHNRKEVDSTLATGETKQETKGIKRPLRACNQIKVTKTNNLESTLSTKSFPNENKTSYKEEENANTAYTISPKNTRPSRKCKKEASYELEPISKVSMNKRPKLITTKNDLKLKRAKIAVEELEVEQKIYHSEGEASSVSLAKKKEADLILATGETKQETNVIISPSRTCNQTKKRKINSLEGTETTKSIPTRNKTSNNEEKSANIANALSPKKTRQTRKSKKEADYELEPISKLSTNERPKQTTTKLKNELKLKKAKITTKELEVKEEIDHSENEAKSDGLAKKKEADLILVTGETKQETNGIKSLSRSCNQTIKRKINSLESFESSKSVPSKNKTSNNEEKSNIANTKAPKETRQTRKSKREADNEFETNCKVSPDKRLKETTTKNEFKLKEAVIVVRKLEVEQLIYHSDEASSVSSADSGCISDLLSKKDRKPMKVESPSSSNLNSSGIGEGDDSLSSESEWEEVEENEEQTLENYNPVIPKEGVEITIDCSDLKLKRRKKREYNEMDCVRLCINRMRKEAQLNVHKCHLLCLLGRGLYVNEIINSPLLKAIALSLVPSDFLIWTKGKKVDKIDSDGIEKIANWFCNSFSYEAEEKVSFVLFANLVKAFETKTSLNASEYNIMFIIIARILGFKARFCMSLYPLSHKATNLIKKRKMKDWEKSKSLDSGKEKQLSDSEYESDVKQDIKKEFELKMETNENSCKKNNAKLLATAKIEITDTNKPKKTAPAKQKAKEKKNISENKVKKSSSSRPRRSTGKNYKMSSDESDYEPEDEDFNIEEEEDFQRPKPFRKSSTKRPKQRTNRKILSDSSDSDYSSPPLYPCYHPDKVFYWAEVFSKPDKQWISVECVHNVINDPYEIEAILPQPVSYVVGIDNASLVKDVTKRYCRNYMTLNIKQRVVSEWWEETLDPYAPPNSKLDKEEEKNLETTLINQPLPVTVSGFKNHPLYALQRHLLKFEAIYPPDAAPVGFIRKEPIYLRENVVQLHSRETWLKEARVVRFGEEPYKFVKARPRWDKINQRIVTDLPPLDIYGFWQTEPYEPPVAVDGKVPRNEYGNVELFKPCMLPKGTVHLQLPGINRIAKKLGIDCAAAFIGFDGNRGWALPAFDGFVICEEFKDTIIEAWEEEQENILKRQEEKREKRIYGNWKKLIRGLLIRERIKLKYSA